MPMFWLMVILILVIVMALLFPVYKPLGRLLDGLFHKIKENIQEDEKDE